MKKTLSTKKNTSSLHQSKKKEKPSIYTAAKQGRADELQSLLASGANVNEIFPGGNTALMISIANKKYKCISILLKANADVNLTKNPKWNSLLIATSSREKKIVKTLLQKDAIVDQENEEGTTALLVASKNGDENILKLLVKYHANINHQRKTDKTTALILTAKEDKPRCLHFLLQCKGIKLDLRDNSTGTALLNTISKKNFHCAQLLVQGNADVNQESRLGISPLMAAVCKKENKPFVELLLGSKKIKVNQQSSFDKKTALHYATTAGKPLFCLLLLKKKAKSHLADNQGHTPLSIATKKGYNKSLNYLLKYSKKSAIKELDKNGQNLLILATKMGHPKCIALLTPYIDVNQTDANLMSPLMHASKNANYSCLLTLLQMNKVKVNQENDQGKTALALLNKQTNSENYKLCALTLAKVGANI